MNENACFTREVQMYSLLLSLFDPLALSILLVFDKTTGFWMPGNTNFLFWKLLPPRKLQIMHICENADVTWMRITCSFCRYVHRCVVFLYKVT